MNRLYRETLCQLCGVSFAIARLRTVHEPPSAAWDRVGDIFVNVEDFVFDGENVQCNTNTGCTFVERALTAEADLIEHIAGPGCISAAGYSG